jgi:serine phosphatase RsbU (regulator of sigma subunit)
VSAAALTSLVRHAAWIASDFDPRPVQVLAGVDTALQRRRVLSVCTALCLRISGDRATIAAGGHPLPIRLGQGGLSQIGSHGTLLGAFEDVTRSEIDFQMQPGETLIAITDGVTDTVGEHGERFGIERVHNVLAPLHGQSAEAICQRLLSALEAFQVGTQADDTAIVVMRFVG